MQFINTGLTALEFKDKQGDEEREFDMVNIVVILNSGLIAGGGYSGSCNSRHDSSFDIETFSDESIELEVDEIKEIYLVT